MQFSTIKPNLLPCNLVDPACSFSSSLWLDSCAFGGGGERRSRCQQRPKIEHMKWTLHVSLSLYCTLLSECQECMLRPPLLAAHKHLCLLCFCAALLKPVTKRRMTFVLFKHAAAAVESKGIVHTSHLLPGCLPCARKTAVRRWSASFILLPW